MKRIRKLGICIVLIFAILGSTPPSIAFNFTVVFENEFEAANTGIENIKHAIKHTAIYVKALFLIVFIKNPP